MQRLLSHNCWPEPCCPRCWGDAPARRRQSDVREYLEEVTGTNITYVTTAAAFVSEQPGLASSGRDYVYLAPIMRQSRR